MSVVEESMFLPIEEDVVVELEIALEEEKVHEEVISEEVISEEKEVISEEKAISNEEIISEEISEEKEVISEEKEVISEEKAINEEKVEIVDFANKPLADIFLHILTTFNEENTSAYLNKIGVRINTETKDLLQKMIEKTPSLFNEIENGVVEVLKDNKIDTSDIPQFIILIQILYERVFSQKEVVLKQWKRSETCAILLKFVIHTLAEERNIITDIEKKSAILIQIDTLIDSCISLLNYSSILEPTKECCIVM
jgi:hypothetical protein